jgi:hypothetical protein
VAGPRILLRFCSLRIVARRSFMGTMSQEDARTRMSKLQSTLWRASFLLRLQFTQQGLLLKYHAALLVADLKADHGLLGGPVDEDVAVVGVEEGQTNSIRIDLVGEANAGLGHVATGGV